MADELHDLIHGTDPVTGEPARIGVLTSGGDAPGMNAAVRAVVRTALAAGAQPYAVLEGWIGALRGGDSIRKMNWKSVSSILAKGGTVIGSARCEEFRTWEGRQLAAKNLLEKRIDRIIVIGGDGSLSGADEFRREWADHLAELVEKGEVEAELAEAHPTLTLVGLVGSIDNDLVGTDMTIGADTALDRIVTAMDQISSTAASHQRTFILEVMGRHCGYLPLMAAVAGGADYVFAPEAPPEPGWQEEMAERLALGREAGRRESIILVAEGARDTAGQPITTEDVARALREHHGEEPRVSILGHIQRGGTPSAYDRWMSTLLGYAAVQELLNPDAAGKACILGVRQNRVARIDLELAVQNTRAVAKLIEAGDYRAAREARGRTYFAMGDIYRVLSDPPQVREVAKKPVRVGILHAGGLAPGMNTAARAAVRIGIHRGWTMLGVDGSWEGLADDQVHELTWSDVEGWAFDGGAELGTRRQVPPVESYYAIGRAIERNEIDALLVIGGIKAYKAVRDMVQERSRFPAFKIPIVLVPASIDNNLPGAELAVGADTALNNNVWALDRIKQSAAASRRCFVAETMGRKCGYLAMMSGIATGAEFVYLNEEQIGLKRLSADGETLRKSFEAGRRLFLVVTNEEASDYYDRQFIAQAFEAAGQGIYDVRNSALGHIQQGGSPTPFDRILATRLVNFAMNHLTQEFDNSEHEAVYVGMSSSRIESHPIESMDRAVDPAHNRPYYQWWMELRPIVEVVSLENTRNKPHEVPIVDVVQTRVEVPESSR